MTHKTELKVGQIYRVLRTLKVRVIVGRYFNDNNIPRDWEIVFKEPFRADNIKPRGYRVEISVGEKIHRMAERHFRKWIEAKKKRPEAILVGTTPYDRPQDNLTKPRRY